MQIHEIMTAEVVTADPQAPVREIAEVMRDPNLAGLVSDEGAIRNPRYRA